MARVLPARIEDYRIIMAIALEEITIMRVRHRSEAYR
jgi:mRNA-degrading endonuclease RelE of RelBE toxin-antitoxin system